MGIDTEAVLEAAGTKWNFLPFRPGLVGGHCIGVAHQQFVEMEAQTLHALGKSEHVLYDLKYILKQEEANLRL